MRIEICIPAYNEELVIREAARTVIDTCKAAGKEVHVTVIDNASTDRTAEMARSVPGVSVLSVPTPGKGAAVIAAARNSSADIFGFIDADLSAHPSEAVRLLPILENDLADIVVGSRLVDTSAVHRGVIRTISSQGFNMLRKLIVGINVEDTQCGLKLMNATGRHVLASCEEKGWFFDMEFLARAERAALRIREIPIRWDEERFPGRKSKLRYLHDAFASIRAMWRIRMRIHDSHPAV
jgi:glycosyltransferase involved in cell wall biosynthesis